MIILTAFTNYTKDQIVPYINSLNSTTFKGRKIVVYYNPVESIVNFLKQQNWEVYTYSKPEYFINVDRRIKFISIIENLKLEDEVICCTDIRDIIFAKNPSDIPTDFFLGQDDNVPIKLSNWNLKSIKLRHPNYYDKLKNFTPLNAGVMVTKGKVMKEFFTDYFKIILERNYQDIKNSCSGVDQSTFNLLAYTKYKSLVLNNLDKYVLHMANMDETAHDILKGYHIYHQYERKKKHYEFVVNLNKKSYI